MFVFTTQPRRAAIGYKTLDKLIENNTIPAHWGDVAEDALRFVNSHLQRLFDKLQFNIVMLNNNDVWEAENSMATIIYPTLVKLKKEKQGAPRVDYEDVPEYLRPKISEIMAYERQGTTDDKYFDRYDYVLNEMIFAFDYIKEQKQYNFDEYDEVEFKRVENGLRLFGKYYFSLWD